jgi:hypothetical protein
MTTETIASTQAKLLRGRITNLRKSRCNQDFFFTDSDRRKMGATAIAAGLAGLGGIAVGLSGIAMDTTEEADLLEFELDGHTVKAWVWLSVFEDGDDVEVVAEPANGHWQGYGIRRTSDKLVALHPHCSRGRYAHYRYSGKLWLKVGIPLLLFMYLLTGGIALSESFNSWPTLFQVWALGGAGLMAVIGIIAFRMSRKFMGFVSLAEGIFSGFGWSDVKNIDLPALTKKSKKAGDPGALGVLFFRY